MAACAHDHDHGGGHSHDHVHGHGSGDSGADATEAAHWRDVLRAFGDYGSWMALEAARRERHAAALSERERRLLPTGSLASRATALRAAIAVNADFFRAVAASQRESGFGGELAEVDLHGDAAGSSGSSGAGEARVPVSSAAHFSKLRSTLHQVARDWSEEGAPERAACYGPILAELARLLPVTAANRNRQRVCIPGCGLARLVWEVAAAGYEAQGNEFSLFMLFTGNYILNVCDGPRSAVVHPWIADPSNHMRQADMLRPLAIPDVDPASLTELNPGASMSMSAGDFVSVYGAETQAGRWDAIVTAFFIDTAPVLFEYLDVIWNALRPGGVWINCGPLLYHWASRGGDDVDEAGRGDERYDRSLELSYDEVRYAIVARGFELLKEGASKMTYAANRVSLMSTVYTCISFTARKPAAGGAAGDASSTAGGGGGAGAGASDDDDATPSAVAGGGRGRGGAKKRGKRGGHR